MSLTAPRGAGDTLLGGAPARNAGADFGRDARAGEGRGDRGAGRARRRLRLAAPRHRHGDRRAAARSGRAAAEGRARGRRRAGSACERRAGEAGDRAAPRAPRRAAAAGWNPWGGARPGAARPGRSSSVSSSSATTSSASAGARHPSSAAGSAGSLSVSPVVTTAALRRAGFITFQNCPQRPCAASVPRWLQRAENGTGRPARRSKDRDMKIVRRAALVCDRLVACSRYGWLPRRTVLPLGPIR